MRNEKFSRSSMILTDSSAARRSRNQSREGSTSWQRQFEQTSVGDGLRPGEFAFQFWREVGLIHPSFAKRAIASAAGNLVRKQLGQLRESDLAKLDAALGFWFGL